MELYLGTLSRGCLFWSRALASLFGATSLSGVFTPIAFDSISRFYWISRFSDSVDLELRVGMTNIARKVTTELCHGITDYSYKVIKCGRDYKRKFDLCCTPVHGCSGKLTVKGILLATYTKEKLRRMLNIETVGAKAKGHFGILPRIESSVAKAIEARERLLVDFFHKNPNLYRQDIYTI